jgi:3-hydroxybutyrate dehydrogenase
MTPRVAVVTGGLTGIGLACAKLLSDAGHKVVVGSRRGADDILAQPLLDRGDAAAVRHLDVGEAYSVDDFARGVLDDFGPVSILVNAAGVFVEGAISNPDTQHWHDQININLTGPFLTTRAFLPGMQNQEFGRIVNIASTAGHVGASSYAGYCASKAGLIALSKVTAQEGAAHNVSCVSLSPTWIETPMMDRAVQRHAKADGRSIDGAKSNLRSSNPQNRLVQADEIAALAIFCCGEACPALTNEDIQINAGAHW